MSMREQELLSQIEALIGETERDAARVEQQDAERDAQRAEAARAGQLGPDWQDVQRRIDAGQTTLHDVFGGQDDSPAAVRLRQQSSSAIDALVAETEPAPELAEEIAAARHDLDHLEAQ